MLKSSSKSVMGCTPYEEVIERAEAVEKAFNTWYEKSLLPDKSDRKGLKALYAELVSKA